VGTRQLVSLPRSPTALLSRCQLRSFHGLARFTDVRFTPLSAKPSRTAASLRSRVAGCSRPRKGAKQFIRPAHPARTMLPTGLRPRNNLLFGTPCSRWAGRDEGYKTSL
jgi:hypothetical protein